MPDLRQDHRGAVRADLSRRQVRELIMSMEVAVHEAADLAAALRLLAFVNREEGLADSDRAGIHRLAGIVQDRADAVLAVWNRLDEATSPTREAVDE